MKSIALWFILQGFKKGFDDVIQRYVLSKNTPAKPSKKKAKGRIEKLDSHGKLMKFNKYERLKSKYKMIDCNL